MEYNIETKSIGVGKVIKEELQEQPVEAQYTLPDYCSDIERILKCRGVARVSSKRVAQRTAYIDGVTTITVIYCDDDKKVCSYEQEIPFYRELALDSDEVDRITVEVNVDYINCKALSKKQIEIKGAVSLKVCAMSDCSCSIVTGANGEGIETKCCARELVSGIGTYEKCINVTDEIEISAGAKPIRNILKTDAQIINTEVRAVTGKALVKGDVRVKILYCTKEKDIECLQSVLPFSQIIDTDGADELCAHTLSSNVTSLDVRSRTGIDGESRVVGINAGVCLCVCAKETVKVDAVEDAFSTKYETKLVFSENPLYTLGQQINQTVNISEDIDIPNGISAVYDLWIDNIRKTVRTDRNSVINGIVTVDVLGLDGEGVPFLAEKEMNFSFESDQTAPENSKVTAEVIPIDVGYTLKSGTVAEIRATVKIDAEILHPVSFTPLVEIKLDEKSPKSNSGIKRAPLVVYFPRENETVFEIARKYNSSVDEILLANDLQEDVASRVLLIPTKE